MSDDFSTLPIAVGAIHFQANGDRDAAIALIPEARRLLGALRVQAGVEERIARGEAGGYFSRSLTVGNSLIQVFTNNGLDSIVVTIAAPIVTPEAPVVISQPPETVIPEVPVVPVKEDEPAVPAFTGLLVAMKPFSYIFTTTSAVVDEGSTTGTPGTSGFLREQEAVITAQLYGIDDNLKLFEATGPSTLSGFVRETTGETIMTATIDNWPAGVPLDPDPVVRMTQQTDPLSQYYTWYVGSYDASGGGTGTAIGDLFNAAGIFLALAGAEIELWSGTTESVIHPSEVLNDFGYVKVGSVDVGLVGVGAIAQYSETNGELAGVYHIATIDTDLGTLRGIGASAADALTLYQGGWKRFEKATGGLLVSKAESASSTVETASFIFTADDSEDMAGINVYRASDSAIYPTLYYVPYSDTSDAVRAGDTLIQGIVSSATILRVSSGQLVIHSVSGVIATGPASTNTGVTLLLNASPAALFPDVAGSGLAGVCADVANKRLYVLTKTDTGIDGIGTLTVYRYGLHDLSYQGVVWSDLSWLWSVMRSASALGDRFFIVANSSAVRVFNLAAGSWSTLIEDTSDVDVAIIGFVADNETNLGYVVWDRPVLPDADEPEAYFPVDVIDLDAGRYSGRFRIATPDHPYIQPIAAALDRSAAIAG